jgi:hypothetical protein
LVDAWSISAYLTDIPLRTVKFIRSGGYKASLKDFATTFDSQKTELTALLTIQTSVTVTKMDQNIEGVSAKIDMLVSFLDVQSPKEKEASALVQEHGGPEEVAKNSEALEEIAKKVGEKYESSMRHALQTDLPDLLEANRSVLGRCRRRKDTDLAISVSFLTLSSTRLPPRSQRP